VNLLAFSAFPAGRKSQADFVPEDAAAFRRVAKKAKWKVKGPKKGFLVQGDDRIGAIADLIGALAAAKINITALDAVSVHGRYGAIFWVASKDLKKAEKVVRAMSAPPAGIDAAIATMGI
jgi:predicted amino acid-binding ACT domain protein